MSTAPPLAAAAIGVSGIGKTAAIERALALYPQCVEHETFPHLIGQHRQLVWLKVEVPESGKASDLAHRLSRATDLALGTEHSKSEKHFATQRRASLLLAPWLRRITGHFLGILVLDEIQNLFKIETLAERRSARATGHRPELRIVDDEALKFILTLINVAKLPIMISGTPDAMAVFETRMSTSQRLTTEGLIHFDHASRAHNDYFRNVLVPALFRYQWLDHPAQCADEWIDTLYRYTAGLPRLCVNMWVQAQRLALERNAKALEVKHLDLVAKTSMAPVRPAVAALLSADPRLLFQYADLTGPSSLL
jgi:hypothetical protein